MTEAQFQVKVLGVAKQLGWQSMHVRRSKGRRNGQSAWQTTTSIEGWPDLVLWHPKHGIIFAELKSDTGKVSPAQAAVMRSLMDAGAEVRVWRPDSTWQADLEGYLP